MRDIIVGKAESGLRRLPVSYNNTQTSFAYPPVCGKHKEVFTKLNQDKEVRPAEGIELALLAYAAYTNNQPEWQDIRKNAFVASSTRVPARDLWLPSGYVTVDGKVEEGLSGVLVERDVKGIGLSSKMQVPDLKDWKQVNGIYVSQDSNSKFVPISAYSDKFEEDGFAIATLSQEGAEIFAKAAYNTLKKPDTWKVDVASIKRPDQRVSMLCGGDNWLYLDGFWVGDWELARGFGVSTAS